MNFLSGTVFSAWDAMALPWSTVLSPTHVRGPAPIVDVGVRPHFLVQDMAPSSLQSTLQACSDMTSGHAPLKRTTFAIGHRGACLQFPEHTKESYLAAIRMGAGRVECDVTFTKDHVLVCRHSQNDLHTTTNILLTPLAAKCTKAFTPYDQATATAASAECRTTDITLAEFKSLRGKMDGFNPMALTPEEYVAGTPSWRTDLYAGPTSGTLMTHAESIALFAAHGVQMTPELKEPVVAMPFNGFTRHAFADKIVQEYLDAHVSPTQVFPQAFAVDDIEYWLTNHPAFGSNAVFLDDADTIADLPTAAELIEYKARGIAIVAPPIWALLATNEHGKMVPSVYARHAKAAGLRIVAWSLDRAGVLSITKGGWYYQTVQSAIEREGDMLEALHVLAKDVGIESIFADWVATPVFYANCLGIV
ncbi:glycerophosphoryl diester phosphodiesterase [Achlya hypogyna]|uniref:glycerophosphodiester phosphodiesterase n=1 Tax=Achlya hypogyna TaxID=1202772 RepID=A0A1V9ZRC1_ACHHY|nr:glycerophosphoryl diester phosphodiesterase [Achlya hypogyna]